MIKVLLVLIAIIVICVGIYAYYGGFKAVDIKIEQAGGETIVYKEVTGDYRQTKSVTDEVYYYLLNDLHIETFKGIGLFYDNPRHVAKEKLRSESGCVVEKQDIGRLPASLESYKVKELPLEKSLIVEREFTGMISYIINTTKVYPAFTQYTEGHNIKNAGPIIEIYDVPNSKIIYRQAISE